MDTGWLASILATQIGLGGTFGFLLGYGLKKIATVIFKIVALVSALFMLALTWLASVGIVTVNYNAITATAGSSFAGAMAGLIGSMAYLSQIFPIGGSFGIGFYIGAKKG